MIARPPLVDFIQRTDVDVFVEPDRSEYVVELDISGGGGTPVREEGRYVEGIFRQVCRCWVRSPTCRKLRPQIPEA